MTRETDKNQALIDFVRLTFHIFPKKELITLRDNNSKSGMSHFMKNFKVKRDIRNCLEEYTRESFFHRIVNTGLRILKHPYELTYLRLPFSHLFWSIKSLYRRHK